VRRELVDRVAPPVYGVIDFLVIIGPALAVNLTAGRSGIGETQGLDLLIASAVIGFVHAIVAARRLASEERVAVRRSDMWIAALDAIVVLALGATLLVIAVLLPFADEHASLADRGYPVVLLWAGIQLVAVAAAEVVSRFVFWWLEPHPRSGARSEG
jgi:hypothetical protein